MNYSVDKKFMKKALDLAIKARGETSPNPMVGAVLVRHNRIIGQGFHRRSGGDHAEIAALKKMKGTARGTTLYVNLEPCFHFGRTPPCVDQVIRSGIKEVVVAMRDPNPLTNGKSIRKLKRSGIRVREGVLKEEAEKLNEAFLKYIRYRQPFIATKTAQTLDGKIAISTGQSRWITSQRTREFARKIRDQFDAIVVGINTVLKDDPHLYSRRKINPLKKIILDSHLRLPSHTRFLKETNPRDCIVATTAKADSSRIKAFEQKGVQVIVAPAKEGQVNLRWLFKELAQREITSILIEGGAHVVGQALKEDLVDKMYIYIAPKIMGDEKAMDAIVGFKRFRVNDCVRLKDLNLENLGEDFLITGYVHRDH